MYNHNKAQQSKNRVHISWDLLETQRRCCKSIACMYGHILFSFSFYGIFVLISKLGNKLSLHSTFLVIGVI